MKAFDHLPRMDPACAATRHGTSTAYDGGCRCPHAREAYRITRKRVRENRHPPQRVDATGTIRRVRAMMVLGWTGGYLASRLGVGSRFVHHLSAGRRTLVHIVTAARIRALCAELGMREGPSVVGRRVARSKGWVTVLAWDDIDDPTEVPSAGPDGAAGVDRVAVEQAINRRVRFADLPDIDRAAVIAELRAAGMGTSAIARRFRTSDSTIRRVDELVDAGGIPHLAGCGVGE